MNVQEPDSLNQPDELSRRTAREWARKLQTTYNWAEVLKQLSQLRPDFRDQVWQFWQLSMFGETDFPQKQSAEEGAWQTTGTAIVND
jgi:hypothetical protein